MASAGKFSVLLNVNHKGQTKKKKKKNVGVDARTPISAVTHKAPKAEQIPPATRKPTAKKVTATPAKKVRPKNTKKSPNSANADENETKASTSYEHSLLDETEQWEEWKKKDEEFVAKMFVSDIEKAIALSQYDSQKQIDLQLAAWLAATKSHNLLQDKTEKDTVHLKNGLQKNPLVQNGPSSSVGVAKQGPSKTVQQVHIEQKKVTEKSKAKNKVESLTTKQTQVSEQENHKTKSEDSEPQLTKAQKKRLKKKKLKVDEVCLKEDETNSAIGDAELSLVNSAQQNSKTEVRVSVPKKKDDKKGFKGNELAAVAPVEDVLPETDDNTISEKDMFEVVPSADAHLPQITQPQSEDDVLVLQYELSQKDLEIAEYRKREMKFLHDIENLNGKNSQLCRLLSEGHRKQKAELLMQIDELTNINDYLTKKIQDLHMLLEQEKSKSEILQQELAKHQAGI